MDTINLTYTKDEANVLLQIIDVATKSGGLNVAEVCVYHAKKIDSALKAIPQEAPEEAPVVSDVNV